MILDIDLRMLAVVIDIFSLIPIPLSSLHSVSQQLSAHSVPSFLLPCVIVRVSCSLLLPGGVYQDYQALDLALPPDRAANLASSRHGGNLWQTEIARPRPAPGKRRKTQSHR